MLPPSLDTNLVTYYTQFSQVCHSFAEVCHSFPEVCHSFPEVCHSFPKFGIVDTGGGKEGREGGREGMRDKHAYGVYLLKLADDIAIFSHSWAEHLEHLRNVFLTLNEARLKVT